MSRYHVVPIEEPKKDQSSTQWSMGLAMFAAFVIPFVLLITSTRYRGFVAQAKAKIEHVSRTSTGVLYTGPGVAGNEKSPESSTESNPAAE
jgi:hypothetical protein